MRASSDARLRDRAGSRHRVAHSAAITEALGSTCTESGWSPPGTTSASIENSALVKAVPRGDAEPYLSHNWSPEAGRPDESPIWVKTRHSSPIFRSGGVAPDAAWRTDYESTKPPRKQDLFARCYRIASQSLSQVQFGTSNDQSGICVARPLGLPYFQCWLFVCSASWAARDVGL